LSRITFCAACAATCSGEGGGGDGVATWRGGAAALGAGVRAVFFFGAGLGVSFGAVTLTSGSIVWARDQSLATVLASTALPRSSPARTAVRIFLSECLDPTARWRVDVDR